VLGINLTKELKDFNNENYKTLKKEIKEDTSKMKRPPMFIDWQNCIKKMTTLPKAFYRLSAIPFKIPITLFTK
jgi:hypothetical protein